MPFVCVCLSQVSTFETSADFHKPEATTTPLQLTTIRAFGDGAMMQASRGEPNMRRSYDFEKHVFKIDITSCKYPLDCDAVPGKLRKHKLFSANIYLGYYFILSMDRKLRL